MANQRKTTLYTGVTSYLQQRVWQHKTHFFKYSFTARYNLEMLVYYEQHATIKEAIAREKEIKKWSRAKKEKLINSLNPDWNDLAEQIFL